MPNAAGAAISLHDTTGSDSRGESYVIAGAEWQGVDGLKRDGAVLPTCVGADPSSFTRVRLGLVTVETLDGGVRHQVTWLECLE